MNAHYYDTLLVIGLCMHFFTNAACLTFSDLFKRAGAGGKLVKVVTYCDAIVDNVYMISEYPSKTSRSCKDSGYY